MDCQDRRPTPSPSWRVQSATLGGRFFASSARASAALPAASPAAPTIKRRRVVRAASFGSASATSRHFVLQGPLITFYFMNVIELPLTPRNFHARILFEPHCFVRGNVAFDQLPNRRAFGALIDAGPARDHVFFFWLDCFAGFMECHCRNTLILCIGRVD